MSSNPASPIPGFDRDAAPLDAARTAFEWLVAGPNPLSIDGSDVAGLPDRPVPVDELRDRLMNPRLPLASVDAAWEELVRRSRAEGGAWTVACVGAALPALRALTAKLAARFADDHRDLQAAVLSGFLAELPHIDLDRPGVLWRLRWAAYRGGHTFLRDALDAPCPSEPDYGPAEPAPPWGHPDFVLARAVADGAITSAEAELIGCTRLEERTLTAAAHQRGVNITALHNVRTRAERRLVAYLADQAATDTPADEDSQEVERHAVDTAAITTAAHHPAPRPTTRRPRTVTRPGRSRRKKSRRRVWKKVPKSGVLRCGGTPPSPASPARPGHSSAPSSSTPEVP